MPIAGVVCENCGQVVNLLWTSKQTHAVFHSRMKVCAQCLYNLDGIDRRGKSIGQVLHEIEKQR